MGPSLGQRVIVVASSNVSIVRIQVTSRRTVLRERRWSAWRGGDNNTQHQPGEAV
ncbi:hypothetical protein A2U01_0076228, partial [Trifolium medium]|nr:hypothetical protein [Trifolium medium]